MKAKLFRFTFHTILLAGFSLSGYAQKLPDVQATALIAPAGIRVDGKNKEWNDSFQALNKRTNIYYTIANDDNNLYVAIKSTEGANNTKIMAGGITFSVNPDGKKKEKESITLTYPLINRGNMNRGGGQGGGRRMMMGTVMSGSSGGQQQSKQQRDSMMAAMQRTQLAQVKEIKISGFKNTTDTLISIYNEHGIKAVASVGADNAFFYEIAIPLAAFGLSKDSNTEFAYNIKLNGLQIQGFDGGGGGSFVVGGGGRGGFGGGGFGPRGGGNSGIDFQALISPTDFWGKYTLARK
ncbi:hypothetical protein SAMN05421820_103503 [Pedobacter steynii]|uniref:T9SS C-terminal target domain-containing protein n=1 Tax=Pedobacter steynii TaxID=430522 RepID=A0A1G9S8R7_9SPHI|nr:hypothetical protein [Pedobacter steynii]NQX37510.1 hypothetical protein [Pedobacter steynii]SDM31717.1 hypothetical protein SAMN05421820_103503 [Pedobacter steynii]